LIANLKFLKAVVRAETRAVLLPAEFVSDYLWFGCQMSSLQGEIK
jgi:hypothetical protein